MAERRLLGGGGVENKRDGDDQRNGEVKEMKGCRERDRERDQ